MKSQNHWNKYDEAWLSKFQQEQNYMSIIMMQIKKEIPIAHLMIIINAHIQLGLYHQAANLLELSLKHTQPNHQLLSQAEHISKFVDNKFIQRLRSLKLIIGQPLEKKKQLSLQERMQYQKHFNQKMQKMKKNKYLQHQGLPVYLLPLDWFQKFINYCRGGQYPGQIDCQKLFQKYNIIYRKQQFLNIKLSFNIIQNKDFIFICKNTMEELRNKFGGHYIKRKISKVNQKTIIQLWYKTYFLQLLPNSQINSFSGQIQGNFTITQLKQAILQFIEPCHYLEFQSIKLFAGKQQDKDLILKNAQHDFKENKSIIMIDADQLLDQNIFEVLFIQQKCVIENRVIIFVDLSDRKRYRGKTNFINCLNQRNYNLQKNQMPSLNNNHGLTGLNNLGNTCFMNSSIQCLSNTYKLSQYFLKNQYVNDLNKNNPIGQKGQLAIRWASLVRQLWVGKAKSVTALNFKKTIAKLANQFAGYAQHDSHQLLCYLLDGLHEDLNRVKVKPIIGQIKDENLKDEELANLYWQNFQKRNQSIICDLIMGQYKSRIECPDCNKISITFDPFTTVSLPVPNKEKCKIKFYLIQKNQEPTEYFFEGYKHFQLNKGLMMLANKKGIDVDLFYTFSIKDKCVEMEIKKNECLGVLETKKLIFVGIKNSKTCELIKLSIFDDKQKSKLFTFQKLIPVTDLQHPENEVLEYIHHYLNQISQNLHLSYQEIKSSIQYRKENKHFKLYMKKEYLEKGLFSHYKLGTTFNIIFKKRLSLQDCLSAFRSTQILDQHNQWYCNQCKCHKRAKKQFQIYRANHILILHLKRFKSGNIKNYGSIFIQGRASKIQEPIQFQHVIKICGNDYELYAVSNHYGGIGGGHYTSYCKNKFDNNWYQFDDQSVRKISQAKVCSPASYILFYRKK